MAIGKVNILMAQLIVTNKIQNAESLFLNKSILLLLHLVILAYNEIYLIIFHYNEFAFISMLA